MPVQLGLSSAAAHFTELRKGGDRRRVNRGAPGIPERRLQRRRKRRITARNLLLTSLTLGIPHSLSPAAMLAAASTTVAVGIVAAPTPDVEVSITSFVVVPPSPRHFSAFISEAAAKYRLDPLLIRSVMQAESAFNPFAVSRAGAMGLMQLMPEVAEELGADDPFDPRQNIMAGARHLRRLLDMHDGDVTLAVASYNAGPTNVARYGGVPPFEETRHYVARVIALLRR